MSAVIGLSNVLRDKADEIPDQARYDFMTTIEQSGIRMQNIINELLLLASVREMKEIKMQALNMARIVVEVRERLAYLIEEHQADVILPRQESWPTALGYGPWVEEVWANYVSNAIKYGGKLPRVELGFDRVDNALCPLIRFWVRDDGDGLSSEEQARLFTPFERLHRVRAQGYGLGLSIVQRIMEKLGGKVGVESQVGQGSVFFFILPGVKETN